MDAVFLSFRPGKLAWFGMRASGKFVWTMAVLFLAGWPVGGASVIAVESKEEAGLKNQVPQFVERMHRADGAKLQGSLSRRLWEVQKQWAADSATGFTVETATFDEFNHFRIVSIDRVTVDGAAAVVEATVTFDEAWLKEQHSVTPDLKDAKMDEKFRAVLAKGEVISDELPNAFQNPFEKDGVGRANFYLIKPGKDWRMDYVYYTLTSMEEGDRKVALEELKKLAADETLRELPNIKTKLLAYARETRAAYAAKPDGPWVPVYYMIDPLSAPNPAFLSVGFKEDKIAAVFYRRRPGAGGPDSTVDIYTPEQWKALTDALAPYRDLESDAGGKGPSELLSIRFSIEQAPKVLDLLATKGWGIPAEKFQAYWRRYTIGM